MLIRYSVSNFRSYKNEATLDFITNSKISTNKSHEYRFGRLSVLKNIGIFGSNAYGKSNFEINSPSTLSEWRASHGITIL